MKVVNMRHIITASLAYFAVVFAAAVVMGALRVTFIAPQVGALIAVAFEVPVILGLAWVVAGRVLRRWPLDAGQRIAMGAMAFAILMISEFVLATLVFARPAASYIAAMATLPGALGLAGQVGFALVPVLRR